MTIKVVIPTPEGNIIKFIDKDQIKVKDLLALLGLSSEEYVVARNGVVVTDEDIVVDGDEVLMYPVVSGG